MEFLSSGTVPKWLRYQHPRRIWPQVVTGALRHPLRRYACFTDCFSCHLYCKWASLHLSKQTIMMNIFWAWWWLWFAPGSKNGLDIMTIIIPIGSMYAVYGNIYHQYTPNVSIYTSTMDPMGYTVILKMTQLCGFLESNKPKPASLPGPVGLLIFHHATLR